MNFPGGTMDKNPPANSGDTCSGPIPAPGRSHMPWSKTREVHAPPQLSLCSEAQEPQLLSTVLQLLKPTCPTAPALQQEMLPQ